MCSRMIISLIATIAGGALSGAERTEVALIQSVIGHVTAKLPGRDLPAPVSNFDFLAVRTTLELGAESKAILIFWNGRRFELAGGAAATLGPDSLGWTRGPVRELDRLPPLPHPQPIVMRGRSSPGAVRIRNGIDLHLMPVNSYELPASLHLSFAAVPYATSYLVQLEDQHGRQLTHMTTSKNRIEMCPAASKSPGEAAESAPCIPGRVIKAGARYRWKVQVLGPDGVIAEDTAPFLMASQKDIGERTRFANALRHTETDEASRLALMGIIDRKLGLLSEADEELAAAAGAAQAQSRLNSGVKE
jgi:hypothetical protein